MVTLEVARIWLIRSERRRVMRLFETMLFSREKGNFVLLNDRMMRLDVAIVMLFGKTLMVDGIRLLRVLFMFKTLMDRMWLVMAIFMLLILELGSVRSEASMLSVNSMLVMSTMLIVCNMLVVHTMFAGYIG